MNRIQPWVDDDTSRLFPPAAALARARCDEAATEAHSLFTPQHYERNYAYPLVVWLHGAEDDERQINRIMPLVSLRNFAAIAPRGTAIAPSGRHYTWGQTADEIELAAERTAAAIEYARTWLNIHDDRIFLAGLDVGGTMAVRLALADPKRFAGVISLSGPMPRTHRPMARLIEARRLSFLLASARENRDYTQAHVCSDLRLLHAAGMSLCLRQYPGADPLTSGMLSDVNRWIMEQIDVPVAHEQGQPSAEKRNR